VTVIEGRNLVSVGKGLDIYYEVKGVDDLIFLIPGTPAAAFL
jgi:hypothetical protein